MHTLREGHAWQYNNNDTAGLEIKSCLLHNVVISTEIVRLPCRTAALAIQKKVVHNQKVKVGILI